MCRAAKDKTWIYFSFKTISVNEMLLVLFDITAGMWVLSMVLKKSDFGVQSVRAWLRVWKIVGLRGQSGLP